MVRQNDQLKLGYSICSTAKLLSKKISFNWNLKEIQKQEVFTLKITELLTINFVLIGTEASGHKIIILIRKLNIDFYHWKLMSGP